MAHRKSRRFKKRSVIEVSSWFQSHVVIDYFCLRQKILRYQVFNTLLFKLKLFNNKLKKKQKEHLHIFIKKRKILLISTIDFKCVNYDLFFKN